MTSIHPSSKARVVSSFEDAGTRRFAHIYDADNGTFRLRYGTGMNSEPVLAGLKEDDAHELFAMWMVGATMDEMLKTARKMGVL